MQWGRALILWAGYTGVWLVTLSPWDWRLIFNPYILFLYCGFIGLVVLGVRSGILSDAKTEAERQRQAWLDKAEKFAEPGDERFKESIHERKT